MASARQKFTFERLRRFELTEGKSREFLWDSDVTMLACRATKGTKAFIFQSVFLGKTLRMTIGNISDWKIDDARTEARRLQTLIDTGIDPRIAKAEKIAALQSLQVESRRGKVIFSIAWEEYIKELENGISAKTKRPYSQRYLADHIRLSDRGGNAKKVGDGLTIAAPLACFLDLPLSDISPALITDWLTRERQTRPTVTANSYRILRTFLKWVEDHKQFQGIIPVDLTQDRNVRKMVPISASKADDCVSIPPKRPVHF